jgi:hypothetical protein
VDQRNENVLRDIGRALVLCSCILADCFSPYPLTAVEKNTQETACADANLNGMLNGQPLDQGPIDGLSAATGAGSPWFSLGFRQG